MQLCKTHQKLQENFLWPSSKLELELWVRKYKELVVSNHCHSSALEQVGFMDFDTYQRNVVQATFSRMPESETGLFK